MIRDMVMVREWQVAGADLMNVVIIAVILAAIGTAVISFVIAAVLVTATLIVRIG